jgi:hypothetical protein
MKGGDIMVKKILALAVCIATFNMGLAYAFDGNSCISCSAENEALIKAMGFTVEETAEGMVITNTYTGETRIIAYEQGNACKAYAVCLWFTFWIAYGIFFVPCMVGYFANC